MLKRRSSSQPSPKTRSNTSAVFRVETRDVPEATRLLLFVRAGGRCEFDGCNEYLLEHHVTRGTGVYGEVAHIVAFRPNGPRGGESLRVPVHDVSNLMLVCARCHKEIDRKPHRFTRTALEAQKNAHERRIRHVTALGPDRSTAVVVLKTQINGQLVSASFDQIVEATAPRYPSEDRPCMIDLTAIPGSGPAFIQTARDTIRARLDTFFAPEGEGFRVGHVSVFALAPIPLLICLGRQLTNKVPSELYQRHRDTETWTWKRTGKPVEYATNRMAQGEGDRVALVLSLSGKIRLVDLPDDVRSSATVYELTLAGQTPRTTFLRTKRDLDRFRIAYQEALGRIVEAHGPVPAIELFAAVPAPVATLCGRELLPKVHPRLRVYDNDRARGGFTFQLEV